MPVSPFDLQRETPTQQSITALIDKELAIRDKFTVEGAPYLVVDAPVGFIKFKDEIIQSYKDVGWIQIEYRMGKHEVEDKLFFYTKDAVAPIAANEGPLITFTCDKPDVIEGEEVVLRVVATDKDGLYMLELYEGTTLIARENKYGYLHRWTPSVGVYAVTAKATDYKGVTSVSPPIIITVTSPVIVAPQPPVTNQPPVITLSASLSSVFKNYPVSFTATANDVDGTIVSVNIYNGNILLGSALQQPFIWTPTTPGAYSIVAKATDNKGLVTTSSPVAIVVMDLVETNQAPTVTLTSSRSNIFVNEIVTLSAIANDVDGTIVSLNIYDGNTLLGSALNLPYVWMPTETGSHSITAKATDDKGLSTTSTAIIVTVDSIPVNVEPTVSLFSTVTSAFIGDAVTFTGIADDVDGTIVSVDVYDGNVLLGSLLNNLPYTWVASNIGIHTITAKATDDKGAISISLPIVFEVKEVVVATPTVSTFPSALPMILA